MSTETLSAPVQAPAEATFVVELSKLIEGHAPELPNAKCEFHYKWDFKTNMGTAQLLSINGTPVQMSFTAMGLAGTLSFIATPWQFFNIGGHDVFIRQVVMSVNIATNDRSATMMFNTDGSVIQATPNKAVSAASLSLVPPEATFNLVLSKVLQGNAPVLPDANCTFHYSWNFETNMGSAQLLSINGTNVNIPLFPLGIAGMLDFMSDMQPATYNIGGHDVVIDRVILDINLATDAKSGAIMFNPDGSVIQATPNFVTEHISNIDLPVPPQAKFTLVLSKLYKGSAPVLPNANCVYQYKWDFVKNMGSAQLVSINGTPVNIQLNAMGSRSMLGFMSDMQPTSYNISGHQVTINRVILNVMLLSGERRGAIMFNNDGSVIQTTPNFAGELGS